MTGDLRRIPVVLSEGFELLDGVLDDFTRTDLSHTISPA